VNRADLEVLQSAAASDDPWRTGEELVLTVVTEEALRLVADVLDGPDPSGLVPPMWLWPLTSRWPTAVDLGPDGHSRRAVGHPTGFDWRRMFAGGRVSITRAPAVGDVVSRRTTVGSCRATEGRSGAMLLVTLHHDYVDHFGGPLGHEEHDLAYRVVGPAGPGPSADGDPFTPARDAPVVGLDVDRIRLFRFSALTANSHRIHYDEAYATGVEGLPGILVHGPLLALLMLEVARREPVQVREFAYRLRRPVVADQEVTAARVGGSGDRWEMVVAAGGTIAATGEIVTD
jgi:3-methylfumaryl-CoA hydratase